jgi:chaperone modulatory protein CbpM
MSIRLEAVVTIVPGVAAEEVQDWVARGWVLPRGAPPDWAFAEIDIARVRLIRDLRHDLGVEEETLPLVLSLLDQVYELRRRLRAIAAAEGPRPLG